MSSNELKGRLFHRVKLRSSLRILGLTHATGVHERNTVPYARFALKKRHGFCAKAREKNMPRHRLGTVKAQNLYAKAHSRIRFSVQRTVYEFSR